MGRSLQGTHTEGTNRRNDTNCLRPAAPLHMTVNAHDKAAVSGQRWALAPDLAAVCGPSSILCPTALGCGAAQNCLLVVAARLEAPWRCCDVRPVGTDVSRPAHLAALRSKRAALSYS